MYVVTATKRRGVRKVLGLRREGLALLDPGRGWKKATQFLREEDAEEAIRMLAVLGSGPACGEVEKIEGARLGVTVSPDPVPARPTVICVRPPQEHGEGQETTGFVQLWRNRTPRTTEYVSCATLFADAESARQAGTFMGSLFRNLKPDTHRLEALDYARAVPAGTPDSGTGEDSEGPEQPDRNPGNGEAIDGMLDRMRFERGDGPDLSI